MPVQDLNTLVIPDDGPPGGGERLVDCSAVSADGQTEVFFRNIREHLVEKIAEADVVVGCVAWLTCEHILRALAKKKVFVVVQKEDFCFLADLP